MPDVDSTLTIPFSHWLAFHFKLDQVLPWSPIPVDLSSTPEVPDQLTVQGQDATPTEIIQTGPHLDLYPLTVPNGFICGANLAVLFTELMSEHDETLQLVGGADWATAWYCNGKLCFNTFDGRGNRIIPPGVFDYDIELPLRRGINLIGVVVLAGGRGFELFCAKAPVDLKERRQDALRAAQEREEQLRAQLRHPAVIEVDCAQKLGSYTRTERYPSINLHMADAETVCAFEREIGKAEFLRSFGVLRSEYLECGTDWRPTPDCWRTRYLQHVATISKEIMFPLPLHGVKAVVQGELSEDEYRKRLVAALFHLRDEAPCARWIEIYNESEVPNRYLSTERLYRFYQLLYQAVDEVNTALPALPPLQTGGPTPCSFNRSRLQTFLDLYAADTDTRKRLDFLAFHQYLFRSEARPIVVDDELETVRGWLAERGLNPDLPIHISENGLFPTRNGTEQYALDLLTQAAGTLTLHERYMRQGKQILPYGWTWFHANPRKNVFVPNIDRLDNQWDGSSGPGDPIREALRPHCDHRADRFTPFGHALRLQAMLRDELLAAHVFPQDENGMGLHAVATGDDEEVSVLIWNYQFTRYEGGEEFQPQLTLANLPAHWRGRQLRLRQYQVDLEHSHYMTGNGELECIQDKQISYVDASSGPLPCQLNLPVSAISLVRVCPIH